MTVMDSNNSSPSSSQVFPQNGKDTTGEGGIDLITFMGLMSLWGTGHRSFANVSWGEFKDPLYIRNLVWIFHKKK